LNDPASTGRVSLNGIAHIYITVQDYPRCLPYYEAMLAFFDMQVLVRTDVLFYAVGSRTGIGIRAASAEHAGTPFDQYRAGMHHLCLRARSREDVDRCAEFIAELCAKHGGRILHMPVEDGWAPGYYSLLWEDPCGTRLEINHVPGKGNLDPTVDLPLKGDVQTLLSQP
jgi:catechol 2,3-dioxygenase-like lactoylglutathione lyase family enzyme